jgi:probable addiction module antidote protein
VKDEYAPLDIASHLDNETVIAEYLTAAEEEDDPRVLIAAMTEVAKSRGLAQVAAAAAIGRESLAAALSGEGAPSFSTIRAVLRGLGVKLAIEPAPQVASDAIN